MYHPELFPELAMNNLQNPEPLVINSDEKRKLSIQKKSTKKEKSLSDEITIIQDKKSKTLAKKILEKSEIYGKIDKHNYSSRYEVQPILDEIMDIGVKYLIPNFEKQKSDSAKTFNKLYGNILEREIPIPEIKETEDELYDLHIKNEEDLNLNRATYNYIKEINKDTQSNMNLRDIIVEMKKEKKFNPIFDIRSLPYDHSNMKKENEKFVELNREKNELTNLLKKIENVNENELTHILRDFQVEDKEELILNINNSINEIERELYLTKNQLSDKKEKKKVVERKKQMMNLVKSLRDSHETKKKGERKVKVKSGLRKRVVEKKIKTSA
jgi:hypothetical protein